MILPVFKLKFLGWSNLFSKKVTVFTPSSSLLASLVFWDPRRLGMARMTESVGVR